MSLPADLATHPRLDTWVRLDPDGETVTVYTGKVELGQGLRRGHRAHRRRGARRRPRARSRVETARHRPRAGRVADGREHVDDRQRDRAAPGRGRGARGTCSQLAADRLGAAAEDARGRGRHGGRARRPAGSTLLGARPRRAPARSRRPARPRPRRPATTASSAAPARGSTSPALVTGTTRFVQRPARAGHAARARGAGPGPGRAAGGRGRGAGRGGRGHRGRRPRRRLPRRGGRARGRRPLRRATRSARRRAGTRRPSCPTRPRCRRWLLAQPPQELPRGRRHARGRRRRPRRSSPPPRRTTAVRGDVHAPVPDARLDRAVGGAGAVERRRAGDHSAHAGPVHRSALRWRAPSASSPRRSASDPRRGPGLLRPQRRRRRRARRGAARPRGAGPAGAAEVDARRRARLRALRRARGRRASRRTSTRTAASSTGASTRTG